METTKKRLDAVDLARGLAVLFMIAVHVLEVYANTEVTNSVFGQVIAFLGGPPAAPVFMMLMGLSFAYAKRKDMRSGIIRGFKIFLSGYILNFLRGVLPMLTAKLLGISVTEGMTPEQSNLLNIFLIADILQFAGIALIIMSVIRELQVSRYALIIAAFIISMVSPFLWGIKVDVPVLGHFIDLLWGDKPLGGFMANMVNFPVFPWITFPFIGMAIGEIFSGSINLSKSYKKVGIMGGLIMITGLLITASNPNYHINDYYHSRQGAMIYISGFTLLWLYLCSLLTEKIKRNGVFELLFNWSRNVTSIYFIQWVIIAWGVSIFRMNENSLISTILITIFMATITHFLNQVYFHITKPNK